MHVTLRFKENYQCQVTISTRGMVLRKKKKSKLKKGLFIGGVIVAILLIASAGYGYYLYHSVQKTATKVYKPLKTTADRTYPLKKTEQNSEASSGTPSINILLLGVDERTGDKGRSDTMIVATLNPSTHSMLMTSIPRDTRVQIPGRSGYSKINAAYAYGDEDLAVQTVEKYMNIDIPYYVKVNMEGISSLVDAVGGVTVDNDISWTDEGYYKKGYVYQEGNIHLDGPQALGYVRMRHLDPRGDLGRNLRQRQVIQAILQKGKSFTSITNMNNILDVLGDNVTTNLTFNDMKRLVTDYDGCQDHIEDYQTKGTSQYIDGVSWVIVTDQEFQNVHDKIEAQMNAK